MAIVGVSGDSFDIAERLSHTTREVEVFLAHYKEPAKATTNGFAGVFDLRVEPERLTARIWETVHGLNRPMNGGQPCPGLERRQLDRFLEMQRKLPNQAALFDSILHHTLQVARAHDGVLLLPDKSLENFRVVASSEGIAANEATFLFSQPCLKRLRKREVTTIGNEDGFIDWKSGYVPLYEVALPIVNNSGLCACILADDGNHSPDLRELLEGVGFLFEELTRKEAKAARENLLSQARDTVESGWALADSRGRVLYREGRDGSWISRSKSRIEEARVLDLIKRAFVGSKARAKVRGRLITGHAFSTATGSYCVLETKESTRSMTCDVPSDSEISLLTSVLRHAFADTPQRPALDLILKNLKQEDAAPFPTREMREAGADIKPPWHEVSTCIAGPIALIVLVSNLIIGEPLNASFKLEANTWFLTLEMSEKRAEEKLVEWANEPVLRAAMRVSGLEKAKLHCGLFGFQLAGTLNPRQAASSYA